MDQGFEAGMDEFFSRHPERVTAFLREMALYFVKFEPLIGNHYRRLLEILKSTRKKAIFVSLNYDVLFESAATQVGLTINYGGPSVTSDSISFYKIHGSCHFLPLPSGSFSNCVFVNKCKDGSILEADCRPARSTQEVVDFCREQNSIAPAIAMYAPFKRVLYCPEFVNIQRRAWEVAVFRAARVYVIGVGVNPADDHIWGPLARTTAPIYYVSRDPDEFVRWCRTERGKRRKWYVMARTFEEALPILARQLAA